MLKTKEEEATKSTVSWLPRSLPFSPGRPASRLPLSRRKEQPCSSLRVFGYVQLNSIWRECHANNNQNNADVHDYGQITFFYWSKVNHPKNNGFKHYLIDSVWQGQLVSGALVRKFQSLGMLQLQGLRTIWKSLYSHDLLSMLWSAQLGLTSCYSVRLPPSITEEEACHCLLQSTLGTYIVSLLS